MNVTVLLTLSVLCLCAGCTGETLFLPEGSAEAGRAVFQDLRCYDCHQVLGEEFPNPTAIPPVPVVLGDSAEKKSRLYLAESLVAPSHQFATPSRSALVDASMTRDGEYLNIKIGNRSRMTDFSDRLTVRQWLDLVAYLESLQERKASNE